VTEPVKLRTFCIAHRNDGMTYCYLNAYVLFIPYLSSLLFLKIMVSIQLFCAERWRKEYYKDRTIHYLDVNSNKVGLHLE
jgi:hypothetical protein